MAIKIRKNIELANQHGHRFLADVFSPEEKGRFPLAIFAHGFKGFKDWGHWHLIAGEFANANIHFVKFNFSHNGTTLASPEQFDDLEAFGRNNFSLELDDLQAVINAALDGNLLAEPSSIDDKRVALIGHSRGGGSVILKAAEEARITRLITWASVAALDRYWPSEQLTEWQKTGVQYVLNGRTGQQMPLYYQIYEDYFANKQRLDISMALAAVETPMLIIHGQSDAVVKQEDALLLHRQHRNSRLLMVPDADHTFNGQHPWTQSGLSRSAQMATEATIKFIKQSSAGKKHDLD